MDRVQKARKKSVGKQKVAVDSKADRLLPAWTTKANLNGLAVTKTH
jgi:hypothetical protein